VIIPGKKPATTALAGYAELLDVEVTEEPRAAGAVGGGAEFSFVVFGIIMAGIDVDVAELAGTEETPPVDDGDELDGDGVTSLSSSLATHQSP
jgi:hypothetical protein